MSSFLPTCIPDACPKTLLELVFNDDVQPLPIPFGGNGTAAGGGGDDTIPGDLLTILLMSAGNELPSAGTWSYDWFRYDIPNEFFEQFLRGGTFASVFVATLIACLSYQMFYKYWMKRSKIFRDQLSSDGQITVIQHTIQAVYLTVFFIPVSYALLSVNFQVPTSEESAKRNGTIVAVYMVWIINIYLIELGAKFRSMRALVLVHHLCAAGDAILPLYVMSPVNLRCAAVLTYFITWEAGVFFGLLMYRLYPYSKWTPRVIKFGMFLFAFSRPIQMLWIVMIAIELWEYSEPWHCIVSVLFGVFFSFLQLYSLVIHTTR